MRTKCPECKAVFRTRDEYIGKRAKCPKCGVRFLLSPIGEGPPETETPQSLSRLTVDSNRNVDGLGIKGDNSQIAANAASSHKTAFGESTLSKGADTPEAQPAFQCVFCGRDVSIYSTYPVTLCRVVRTVGSDIVRKAAIVAVGGALGGLVQGKTVLYQKRTVMVPSCSRCKDFHQRREARGMRVISTGVKSMGVIGVLLGIAAAGYVRVTEQGPLIAFLFLPLVLGLFAACLGLLIGTVLSSLIDLRKPKEIGPEKKARQHPIVTDMLAQGWKVGQVPSEPAGAQFALLSEEGEKELGVWEAGTTKE